MTFQVDQQVKIRNTFPRNWFGAEYPEYLDGQVTKVYKNGKCGVWVWDSVNGRRNKVFNFPATDLT